MAFRFANEGKVWWRVNLVARDVAGDEPTDVPVYLLYKIYTRRELKERDRSVTKSIAKLQQGKDADGINDALRDVEAIDAANIKELTGRVLDWREIVDEAGEPLKFTAAHLKALIDDDAQYARITAGLLEASKGARAKN